MTCYEFGGDLERFEGDAYCPDCTRFGLGPGSARDFGKPFSGSNVRRGDRRGGVATQEPDAGTYPRRRAAPDRQEGEELSMFNPKDVIHSYSRRQAIEDGVLIDVTATAKEAGVRYPVALTRAAWDRCVAVPPGLVCQDESGRLWDVCYLFASAARGCREAEVRFSVHVRNDNRDGTPPLVRLKAVCGPGDEGEAVITIMLPHED